MKNTQINLLPDVPPMGPRLIAIASATSKQPDPIVAYEWTHEERPCRCTPEHRQFCHRCGGSGIYKSARLRRIDATTTHQAATDDSATGADHQAASA